MLSFSHPFLQSCITTLRTFSFHSVYLPFATVLLALYVLYLWALPKPIPNIPYRVGATRSILGDLSAIAKDITEDNTSYLQWIAKQMEELHSPIVQLFLYPLRKPVVFLADFREIQDILLRRKDFDRSDTLRDFLEHLLPNHHIYEQTNEVWKSHRRLLQDLMSPSFLYDVAGPALHANVAALIRLWDVKARVARGRPFSATEDIPGFVLDAVYTFTFGDDYKFSTTQPKMELLKPLDAQALQQPRGSGESVLDPLEFPEAKLGSIIEATHELTKAFEEVNGSPVMKLKWKLLMMRPHLRNAKKIKDDYLLDGIKRAVSRLSSQPKEESSRQISSAVDHMVRRETLLAQKEGRSPDYFSQIMLGEVYGLVLGGYDTTSTATLWGLKFMADKPDVQTQLRRAMQSSFPEAKTEGRNPSFRELTKRHVPYLDAVVEEILRRGGTTPLIERQTMADTRVLGYDIPKGTTVLMLTQGPSIRTPGFDVDERRRSDSCRAAKLDGKERAWSPQGINDFDPERWLVPGSSAGGNGQACQDRAFDRTAGPTLAFGLGTRGCFGRKLGYLQLKVSVAMIVWNFELLPCSKDLSTYETLEGLTSMPKYCYVRLQRVNLKKE